MNLEYSVQAITTITLDQDEAEEISYVLRQGLQAMYEAGETNEAVADLRDTLANWARQ
jgi:hypothetical protein